VFLLLNSEGGEKTEFVIIFNEELISHFEWFSALEDAEIAQRCEQILRLKIVSRSARNGVCVTGSRYNFWIRYAPSKITRTDVDRCSIRFVSRGASNGVHVTGSRYNFWIRYAHSKITRTDGHCCSIVTVPLKFVLNHHARHSPKQKSLSGWERL
jgi:hypothetical protein